MEDNIRLYEQQQMAEQAAVERIRNENVDDDEGPPELRNESDDEDDKSSNDNSDDDDDDKLLTQLGVTLDKIDVGGPELRCATGHARFVCRGTD